MPRLAAPRDKQLLHGSQRKNGLAQLLMIFRAVVDLRRYAKQDFASVRERRLPTLLNLSLRSASNEIGLHPSRDRASHWSRASAQLVEECPADSPNLLR